MRLLLIALLVLFFGSANAAQYKIPWKGDHAHNSDRIWSPDNRDDSGYSKNFLNGTPEEGGKVQKDGELWVETLTPENTAAPVPFVVLMHGCMGMSSLTSAWAHRVARFLNAEGIGVLILDSFTTRKVEQSCGMPDLHWARRRADDAYSALDYLVEHKLARPDEVYVMGQSGGGSATLVAMTTVEADHRYKFAAGFPVVPQCIYSSVRNGNYSNPLMIFVAEKDDANDPRNCTELSRKQRPVPVRVVVYRNADHGFMEDYQARVMKGWTDRSGKDHYWHLSYNPAADKDMMQTIATAIRTRKFGNGVEFR
jgi:dienelactone hydrolase